MSTSSHTHHLFDKPIVVSIQRDRLVYKERRERTNRKGRRCEKTDLTTKKASRLNNPIGRLLDNVHQPTKDFFFFNKLTFSNEQISQHKDRLTILCHAPQVPHPPSPDGPNSSWSPASSGRSPCTTPPDQTTDLDRSKNRTRAEMTF